MAEGVFRPQEAGRLRRRAAFTQENSRGAFQGCRIARERAGDTREQALAGMLGDYVDRMDTGEPVHTWTH